MKCWASFSKPEDLNFEKDWDLSTQGKSPSLLRALQEPYQGLDCCKKSGKIVQWQRKIQELPPCSAGVQSCQRHAGKAGSLILLS
jgi:hypothetical protein